MNKKIDIYVYTYRPTEYSLPNDEIYHPVICGYEKKKDVWKNHNEEESKYLKDNTGDNISVMNGVYCEGTGIYWVWKNNMGDSDIIGQEHHRRHLVIDKNEIEKTLEEYDIILPKPITLQRSLDIHYRTWHNETDIAALEQAVKTLYPDYASSYDEYIKNSNKLYYGNLYITTRENYDKINEFIFSVLDKTFNILGVHTEEEIRQHEKETARHICPNDHMKDGDEWLDYQSRVAGFFFERLHTLYFQHNFKGRIKHVELKEVEREERNGRAKTLLCCIGRLENDYIREYVEYYKSLGFTNICLYDNNRDGEDDFHDVIGDYIDSGFVILKDYRNKTVCQLQAYQECYDEYGHDYDWIAFFDIDEFLELKNDDTIGKYVGRREFDECDAIHINWLIYGDGGEIESDGRPLLERITTPNSLGDKTFYEFPDTCHVKSIIRGGLKKVEWTTNPHTPSNFMRCRNNFGAICDSRSPFISYTDNLAVLKHFTTKTAREYAKKVKRGFPDGNATSKEKLCQIFFKRNTPTQEKIDIFKEELGLDFSYLLKRKNMDKRKDVQIFNLCYSKKDYVFKEDSVITPLQVGAANGTDVCELKDNTGDNISGGNFFYIENTGVYWIWQNIKDAKYKGQMQYRRLLHGIDENTDFEEIFKDHDVITCVPYHYPDHDTPQKDPKGYIPAKTVEKGYAFSNCFMDLSILESVIKTNFPEYREDYDKYIKKGEDLYYSAGYIMKSEDYDRYAQFLFNCLGLWLGQTGIQTPQDLYFHVGRNFGMGFYSQRYPNPMDVPKEAVRWQCSIGGFLAERIWTLWLMHNFKPERIYKVEYDKQEENQWI